MLYILFQICTFSNHTYTNITSHLFIETTNDAFCSQIYRSNSFVHDLKSQITLALRSIQYQYTLSTPVNRQQFTLHSIPWSRVLFEQLIGPQLFTIKCRQNFCLPILFYHPSEDCRDPELGHGYDLWIPELNLHKCTNVYIIKIKLNLLLQPSHL
jgi:hypothetical protein